MKSSNDGVEISKAELGCLLFYAGKTDFAVVHFRVDGKRKLVVSAGDGKRSVQCQAPAGNADPGEWTVPAFYLERVRRGMDKGRTDAVLEFTSKGLKSGHLVGAASRTRQLKLEDETNGTSTQVSIEELRQLAKNTPLDGSWFALVPKQVNRATDVLSKAADGCPVTYYPPQQATGLLLLECTAEDGCKWLAALPTALVEAPGGSADEEEEDETPGRPPKQAALPGTEAPDEDEHEDDTEEEAAAGGDDGIVDDDYKPGATQKKAKKKATKKTVAKKAAKKAGKKK